MKLYRNWLDDFTSINADDKEYCDVMTMTGSKVEGCEVLGSEISNVVVGRVISIVRHENSDHLWVCTVDAGQTQPVQIVTGAQNVRQGDLVPVALHGASLPGGIKIKKGNLRGVKSEGMLCSLSELGLTLSDYPYAEEDGIFILRENCAPGDDIRKVTGLNGSVIEFEITNNRPDCLSVRGLARESAISFRAELNLPEPKVKGSGDNISSYLDVDILDPVLCPRYTARYVKNVKIGPSPLWLRTRLRASGVRPINNIVDITNYVMLEYGQPMHSFDYSCITGNRIIVRRAHEGETMSTLDGSSRTLTRDMLVIADETKAIGLAGVMGAENSEITETTKSVVFESANFNGVCIRKTAIALGMRTDASSRFEKGLDPLGTLPAVERACELVELLGAGEVVDGVIDVIAADSAPVKLPLEPGRINALLGTNIDKAFMIDILTKLGFIFDGDIMTVPSWRGDVKQCADVAEEVARFWGYDKIEPSLFKGVTAEGGLTPRQSAARHAGELLRGMGFYEMLTYSFMGQSSNDKVNMPAGHPLRRSAVIQNPLGEDSSVMRTTMLPSLLETLGRNYSYRNRDVRVYELARVYIPGAEHELADEKNTLVLGCYGEGCGFYNLKGCVEALLESLRVKDAVFTAEKGAYAYHPGRCAKIAVNGTQIGIMGQIDPRVADNYGISQEIYAAELDFDVMFAARGPEPVYVPLPRFPSVLRDLSAVCDSDIPVSELRGCIAAAGGSLLKHIGLFDVYTGSPIPEGSKSVSFSLEFRSDDSSLTDADISPIMTAIIDRLSSALGAQIRR
ncbi:MAG: phenylalanine--tRNA ligase subunit beta [Clostridiales bacterium]|nr:phenylalanine--tRNA ligase subunit beta [Clostridiales bacterium]